jgi:hypothetical protein
LSRHAQSLDHINQFHSVQVLFSLQIINYYYYILFIYIPKETEKS